jgi:hypothetical protein
MALRATCRTEPDQSPAELLLQRPAGTDRAQILIELRRTLQQYEDRYHIPSHRLRAALDAGELTETLDVCDWLMLYSVLLHAEGQ